MKNKTIKALIIAGTLFMLPITVFAEWSETKSVTYYNGKNSWGIDYGISNIARSNSSTGSSVYGEVSYFNKTSYTNPTVYIVNSSKAYKTNGASLSSTSATNVRLYNMQAKQGELTNITIVGSSLQVGGDTVNIQFTPH